MGRIFICLATMFSVVPVLSSNSFDQTVRLARSRARDSINVAIEYARRAEEIAIQNENETQLARIYWMQGTYQERAGNPHKAVQAYYAALKIYKILEAQRNVVCLYENIGTVCLNFNSNELAIDAYKQALKHFTRHLKDRKLKGRLCLDIALAYEQKMEFDRAMEYALKARNTLLGDPESYDSRMLSKVYLSMGTIYSRMADQFKRKDFLDSCMRYYKLSGDWSEGDLLINYKLNNNIGNVHLRRSMLHEARIKFEKALAFSEGTDIEKLKVPALNNLGIVHFRNRNYEKADLLFRRALALNIGEASPTSHLARYDADDIALRIDVGEMERSYLYLDSLHSLTSNDSQLILSAIRAIRLQKDHIEVEQLRQTVEIYKTRSNEELEAETRRLNAQRWIERIIFSALISAAMGWIAYLIWMAIKKREEALKNREELEIAMREIAKKFPKI